MQGENGQTTVAVGVGDGLRRLEPSEALVQLGTSQGTLGSGQGAQAGQGHHAALPQAPQPAFLVQEHIAASDLDEIVKREALSRLRCRGLNMSEGRFFERGCVERFGDGSVRVTVVE